MICRAKRKRASAAKRLYGRRWQRAARLRLAEHPLCAECLRHGRVTPATVVDHVRPHRGNVLAFWTGAWQSLCVACHARKTAAGQ